jgi:hypothetical protein
LFSLRQSKTEENISETITDSMSNSTHFKVRKIHKLLHLHIIF